MDLKSLTPKELELFNKLTPEERARVDGYAADMRRVGMPSVSPGDVFAEIILDRPGMFDAVAEKVAREYVQFVYGPKGSA